jgi:hypothetical protein
MLFNINLTSRLAFVCQNHRSIYGALVKFSLVAPDTRTYFPCTGMTIASEQLRLLGKEKLPYTRANETSQGKFEKRFPLSEALQQVTLNLVYKSHSM